MKEPNLPTILELLYQELKVSNKDISDWMHITASTATKLRQGKITQSFKVDALYKNVFKKLPTYNGAAMSEEDFLRDLLIPKLRKLGCLTAELERHENDSYQSFCMTLLTVALNSGEPVREASPAKLQAPSGCHLVSQDYHLSAFMGRDDVIEAIHRQLQTAHVAVLSGIGGMGKSYAAIRYAEKYHNGYSNIQRVFFDSDIRHTISKLMFENLDEEQQSEEEIFQNRLKALYRFDQTTLLILDNVDAVPDYENLKALFRSRIHIIITTRLHGHGLEEYLIHIDKLTAADQMNLFQYHLGRKVSEKDMHAVEELFAQVGGHTLLIELLAKTIRNSDMTPDEMLTYLQGDGQAPLDQVEISKDDGMLQATMDQYVSKLFNVNALNAEAIQALMFLTLVPLKGIQRVLFKRLSEFRNNSAVLLLTENSWVITDEGDSNGPRIRLHPVICTVAKQNIPHDFQSCQPFLNNLLAKCTDSGLDETVKEDLRGVSRTIPHAVDFAPDSDKETAYLDRLAKAMWDLCCYKEALELYQFTLNEMVLKAADHDSRPQLSISLYTRIAELFTRLADYDASISHYEKAIEIAEGTYGADGLESAGLYNDIGFVFRKKSDYEAALNYLKKAMVIRENHGDANPLDLAVTYNDIGVVYINMEDYPEAKYYYTKALELRKENPNAAPKDLAYSYHNLGTVAQRKQDFDSAIKNHTDALKIREEAFGGMHPDVSASLNQIGIDYMSRKKPGDSEIAWNYFEKALAIRKKILGESHPDTAWTLFSMAKWHMSQGNYQDAAKVLHQVIDIRRNTIGAQHLYTADARYNLGLVYTELKNYPAALKQLSEAQRVQRLKGADKGLGKTEDQLTFIKNQMEL